jgi:hypothetical protein
MNKIYIVYQKLRKYLNNDRIFGTGFVWDGTKCSTANDAVKDSGPLIGNYLMEKWFVMNATRFI